MLTYVRSHRRRSPVDHVLIAGRVADLACVRAAVAMLPADAYGQVYVQAPAGTDLDLCAPARITVHRVDETASLSDAVDAWVAEWIPEERDPKRRTMLWIGNHAASHVAVTRHGLDGLVEHL